MRGFNVSRIPAENRDAQGRIQALASSGWTLALPEACITDIATSGSNDAAVAAWVDHPDIDWSDTNPDLIRAELKDCGCWDAEQLADDAENRSRILWIMAWNVADDAESYGGGL